jgi:hypothetical protein
VKGELGMIKTSKKTIRNLLTLVLAVVMAFSVMSVPVYAASTDPYGFTYDDAATGKTWYRYYSYNASSKNYTPVREFYSRGSSVYTSKGVLVANNSNGSGSRYNGFGTDGKFYWITSSGSLTVSNLDNTVSVLLESGATKLNYSDSELAITVTTTSGTKSLSTLQDVPATDDNDYIVPDKTVSKNRVEIYTNSAGEMVYDAYSDGKLKTKIIISKNESKVLNATAGVRLTDTLSGAKFVGFDTSYNVYLVEGSTLYRFKQGKWYQAEKLALNGAFSSFKRDDNSFISKIVTSKDSYTIKQLTTSSKWKASKTYAVKKSGYQTLYTKGSTTSNVLKLSSGKLSLNGKQIATGVKSYGFVSGKKFIYITSKNIAYTATLSSPKKTTKVCSKVKSLTYSSVNLVTKVKLSNGKTQKIS